MSDKVKKIVFPLICLLTAIIWGSGFIFQDMGGSHPELIDGLGFTSIRFFLAGIGLIPVILIFEREKELTKEEKKVKNKSTLIFGAISGLILATSAVLQQYGIQLTGESGKAGFITGLYLIIVPIASFIIFKQKPSVFVWIAVPISLVGLYLLSVTNGFSVQLGDLLVVLCAFGYAAQIIFIDKVGDRISALKFSCVQFIVTGIVCFILALIFGKISWDGITAVIGPLLYCGFVSAGAGFTLQVVGQKHTPPTLAALIFSTEGLFATIFECIVEGKAPSLRQIIGSVLMLVAIVLSQIPKNRTSTESYNAD